MKGKKIFGIICLFSILIVGMTSSLSSSIRPPLILNGYVKDSSTNLPIDEATVDLWVYDFRTGWKYIGQDSTDESGHYDFQNLPIGAVKVRISKSNYQTYEGAFQQIIYLEAFSYDYIFYGSIRNSVTSQALSDAQVKITCGTKVITDTTDNSGYYCIVFSYSTSGVQTFEMEASKIGYTTYTNTIISNYGYNHININLAEVRTWLYIEDFDDDDSYAGDLYLKFEIKEFEIGSQYKLVYDVTIEYYYELNPIYSIKVERYCPIGNLWISDLITNDDITYDEISGFNRISVHVVEEFFYDSSTYKSHWCGVRGGLFNKATDMFPFYGMDLVFQLDNPSYGTPFVWEENWFGSYPYGFFGTMIEGNPKLTVSYPAGAWYSIA